MLLQHQLPRSEQLPGHRRDSLSLQGISAQNRFLGFAALGHRFGICTWRSAQGMEGRATEKVLIWLQWCRKGWKNGHSKLQPLSLQHTENNEQSNAGFTKLTEMTQLFKARKEFRAKCDCTRGEGKSHCNP